MFAIPVFRAQEITAAGTSVASVLMFSIATMKREPGRPERSARPGYNRPSTEVLCVAYAVDDGPLRPAGAAQSAEFSEG
jgi:hypothetical protein